MLEKISTPDLHTKIVPCQILTDMKQIIAFVITVIIGLSLLLSNYIRVDK